jgi:hypothetical protein
MPRKQVYAIQAIPIFTINALLGAFKKSYSPRRCWYLGAILLVKLVKKWRNPHHKKREIFFGTIFAFDLRRI